MIAYISDETRKLKKKYKGEGEKCIIHLEFKINSRSRVLIPECSKISSFEQSIIYFVKHQMFCRKKYYLDHALSFAKIVYGRILFLSMHTHTKISLLLK